MSRIMCTNCNNGQNEAISDIRKDVIIIRVCIQLSTFSTALMDIYKHEMLCKSDMRVDGG